MQTSPIPAPLRYTAFVGPRRLAQGPLAEVAQAVAATDATQATVLVFSDATGRQTDLDLRGGAADIAARYAEAPVEPTAAPADGAEAVLGDVPRGRGRPKLGVVAREITLLPRHWDWLATQPGGASVALRKLVEDARKRQVPLDEQRQRRDAAYHFMSVMAGDLPGFEEATRALYAGDAESLRAHASAWPADIRDHALTLAGA